MAALPSELLEQSARETEPDSDVTAAWGEPAITVRCGVADPAALSPTSKLLTVNGVDWFPEELTEGYLFTTQERQVNVEVTVPDDYEPEIEAVTELSGVVTETVPSGSSTRPAVSQEP
jgi:hypothetical protein